MADPDSQRRGGGLTLQAGGLPARHSMNGSVCVCVLLCVLKPVCVLEGVKQREMKERRVGWINSNNERIKKEQ